MLSFKDFMIMEGNPLARMQKFTGPDGPNTKRHFTAISAERSHLTPEENAARMDSLENDIKSLGYGYRKSRGIWEGGGENSFIINAKDTGSKEGVRLRNDTIELGRKYEQDSILHHDGYWAKLHGTNNTGWPGMGKVKPVGKLAFNKRDAKFQTQYNPTKDEKDRPTFTTKIARKRRGPIQGGQRRDK